MNLVKKVGLTAGIGIIAHFLSGKPSPESFANLTEPHKIELTESSKGNEGEIYLANKTINHYLKLAKEKNVGSYELESIRKDLDRIVYAKLFNDAIKLENESINPESKLKSFTILKYLGEKSMDAEISIKSNERIINMPLDDIIRENPNSRIEFKHFALVFKNNYDLVQQATLALGLRKNSKDEFEVTIYGVSRGKPNHYLEMHTKTIDLAKNDYTLATLLRND